MNYCLLKTFKLIHLLTILDLLQKGRNNIMKKKIIGMFVCILLIATAVPTVESLKNSAMNLTIPSNPLPRMDANWTAIQKLLASDGAAYDRFGYTVSLNGDTALIGTMYDDDNGEDSGSVYVFTRTGSTWIQQAKLLASDGAPGDAFGYSVSIDGNSALIGALYYDGNGLDSGSAYVFTRIGTIWTQQAKLIASDDAWGDEFGCSVSLDGDNAVIGARYTDQNNEDSGSVYVFTRTGTTWTQQQKLLTSDSQQYQHFGNSVFLNGNDILIGANGDNENGAFSGAAYVFTRTGTTWTQQAKLLPSDGEPEEHFGCSVSLDRDSALIGAYTDDDNGDNSGSTYVFSRTGTTWTQQAKLFASDGAVNDYFGCCVSLSSDTALIGADGADGIEVDSGAAYVFIRTGTTWTQQAKLLASDGETYDNFGFSVSLNIDTVLIGATRDNDNGVQSGSVYVFTKNQLKKAFIFGRYTNLTEEGGYITIEEDNLWLIFFNPIQFLHYINTEKVTFVKDTAKVITLPGFIIGIVDVVT
jgi:hypothetical protein